MIKALSSYFLLRNKRLCLGLVAAIVAGLSAAYVAGQENNRLTAPETTPATLRSDPSAAETVSGQWPGRHPKSVFGKKEEPKLHPIIFHTANRYQVDPALVSAIIMAESEYNPRAVSRRGARGLMQLMPATAEELGVEDIFNPQQNIDGGVRYFKQLVNRFDGDIILALAAYNAGSRHVRHYKGVPPFKATKRYIKKVFKYYRIYKDRTAVAMS